MINSILSSNAVQSARDVLGLVTGQAGRALHALAPAAHRRFTHMLMRGPAARSHGPAVAREVARLEQGVPALEIVQGIAEVLKRGLAAHSFDRWIEKPKSRTDSTKRTLVRCDNYLPGRRWKLQLFYIPQGRSHPPHSHDDMASCLVVARGGIAAREFNRVRALENGGDTIMLEQASDQTLGPGDTLLTNDDYHNVHWFGAVGGDAVAFNFQIVGFNRGKKPSEKLRSYVDPTADTRTGPFPAPRLGKEEAHARFETHALSEF